MKQILHLVNSLICTPKNSIHVRSQKIRPGKQILPKQSLNPVAHHLNFVRLIHSLSNHSFGETMDNWTAPKYKFMKHTIVLGGSQFTGCIPLSLKGSQNKKSGRIFYVRQVYFTSKSWRQIWWRVNQPFKYPFFIMSEVSSTMRRCFFIIQTSNRICSFLLYLS